MTITTHFARVIASFAMLCIATSVFAQNSPTRNKESGQPLGADKIDISKCPVIGGTLRPATERNTAAGALSNGDCWPPVLRRRHQRIKVLLQCI